MEMRNSEPIQQLTRRRAYKRPFDLGLLLFAHVLLLPLWLALWTIIPLSIWLGDRGPVFYKQRRTGKDGQVFIVHKFRTMVPGADLKGPAWTVQGDVRLTRVGKFLRRTALDELPELWSVLKGDMSFVGPRPLDVNEQAQLEKEIPGFAQRLAVRPGLTGLAQIYDSADRAVDKFNYDLEYMGRMNPWLDVKLLFYSVRNSFSAGWDRRQGKPQASTDVSTELGINQVRDDMIAREKPSSRR